MPSQVIPQIIANYAEDAPFLWVLRDQARAAPHYTVQEFAELDGRLEAHIDGLRIAGGEGLKVAQEEFERYPEAGEAFVATLLSLEQDASDALFERFSAAQLSRETTRGVISALGWVEPARLKGIVGRLLGHGDPFQRMLGVAACSVHRVDPGDRLAQFLDDDAPVRARALRLAGELGRADLAAELGQALDDPDPECQFWAAWSGVLSGDRGAALDRLLAGAAITPLGWKACQTGLRTMDRNSAMTWARETFAESPPMRVIAAGLIGCPSFIPWLIKQMSDPGLARLAGEAMTIITGLDLEANRLVDADAPVADGEDMEGAQLWLWEWDRDLPAPDAGKVRKWWAANGPKLPEGQKHLLGRPVTPDWLAEIDRKASQRMRQQAALEKALLMAKTPLPNCAARLL